MFLIQIKKTSHHVVPNKKHNETERHELKLYY